MENWNGIGTEVKEVAKGQDSMRDDTNESLFVHAQLVRCRRSGGMEL